MDEGIYVGTKLGLDEDRSVGKKVGRSDGVDEGSVEGIVGLFEGTNDGTELWLVVGSCDGFLLGSNVIVGKVEGEGSTYDLQYPQLFGQALLTIIPLLYVSQ